MLGMRCALEDAARLGEVAAPLDALEEGIAAGLVRARESPGRRDVTFVHPLMQAAVYQHLGPARRVRLHLAAAALASDEAAALRHRVAAAPTSDAELAADLERFAEKEAARGAWASAAAALVTAGRVSAAQADHERCLLGAVDAMLYAGDVAQAATLAEDVVGFERGAWRDCVLGFLAGLQSRPFEAERLLRSAWDLCSPEDDPALAATIARRTALHLLQRLRGEETVEWSRRALALSPPGDPAARSAELLPLGVGLGYAGRTAEGLDAVEGALSGDGDDSILTVRRARGWLRLVTDDVEGARRDLEEEADAAMRLGSFGVAAYALGHLGRADYAAGAWDDAVVHAERGLAIAVEFEHPILRSLCALAAVAVPAARGDWDVAERHVGEAAARAGDYEHSLVAAGLAAAQLATAQGDQRRRARGARPAGGDDGVRGTRRAGVLGVAGPLRRRARRAGGSTPPRTSSRPGGARARARRRSMIARLGRSAGGSSRPARGAEAAGAAFHAGLSALDGLAPAGRARAPRFAFGQAAPPPWPPPCGDPAPRRAHAAPRSSPPVRTASAARPRARGLRARADGARALDRDRLTPQERSVARLVASGLTNREVAAAHAQCAHDRVPPHAHLCEARRQVPYAARGADADRRRGGSRSTGGLTGISRSGRWNPVRTRRGSNGASVRHDAIHLRGGTACGRPRTTGRGTTMVAAVHDAVPSSPARVLVGLGGCVLVLQGAGEEAVQALRVRRVLEPMLAQAPPAGARRTTPTSSTRS